MSSVSFYTNFPKMQLSLVTLGSPLESKIKFCGVQRYLEFVFNILMAESGIEEVIYQGKMANIQ